MPRLALQIAQKLHGGNPYEQCDVKNYPLDLQGGFEQPIFKQLINILHPQLILEVGSWKGASAIRMASLLKEQLADGAVICIDTWLGGLDHLMPPVPEWDIRPYAKRGYATLYYQFLSNVIQQGLQDWIVPFPNTSATAARWLSLNRFSTNLVYIDGSHEEDDVYQDCVNYWGLLQPSGVLFGDDWDPYHYGVICGVNRFARSVDRPISIIGPTWVVQKPPQTITFS